jgi:prepilin-type N-terminal cleavage/methylation domain-containing protein
VHQALRPRKGFTLIELLVVIAIIAIISTVVILVLNPAELVRQSRDANRISDMSVLKSAVSYYLASALSPNIGTSTCYESAPTGFATTTCATWFPSQGATSTTSSTATTGTGWIPINFLSLTGGSPIGALPQDPLTAAGTNDRVHLYTYIASSTSLTFKLDAHLESQKYGNGGTKDSVSNDSGVDPQSHEVGSNLTL